MNMDAIITKAVNDKIDAITDDKIIEMFAKHIVEKFVLVAEIQTCDNDTFLWLKHRNGKKIRQIPWPSHWPEEVSRAFLEQHGFEVIVW